MIRAIIFIILTIYLNPWMVSPSYGYIKNKNLTTCEKIKISEFHEPKQNDFIMCIARSHDGWGHRIIFVVLPKQGLVLWMGKYPAEAPEY